MHEAPRIQVIRGAFFVVEVAGIEPASEDIQHNGPTCVVNVLRFASVHAH